MTEPLPGRRLGRLPEDLSRPKLAFGDFVTALPAHPLVDTIASIDYPMDHNDTVGCCVVAGADHALKTIYTLLTGSYSQPDDATLLRWYQSQNPGFRSWADGGGPNDGGMVIAQFLDFLIREGKILAYAKVDHANLDLIRAAIYLGLAVITGEDVRAAQMTATVWDYTPNSPDEGGHCTVCHDYRQGRLGVITWGSGDYEMTDAFLSESVDEAYFVLTQAHVDHPGFRDSFDLPGFANAVSEITGGKVVVPVSPTPTPPPAPAPDADADQVLAQAVRAGNFLAIRHRGEIAKVANALKVWLAAKGL